MVHTLASLMTVFLCDSRVAQEGLGASARRCPFRGPSAKVIQLPDMKLSKNTGVNLPLYYPSRKIRKWPRDFWNFFSIYLGFCFSVLDDMGIISPLHPTTDKFSANHNPLSEKFFERERDRAVGKGLRWNISDLRGQNRKIVPLKRPNTYLLPNFFEIVNQKSEKI